MIYTLTFNASLDYYANADSVEPGAIHKISEYKLLPGGKGINVSQVLKEMGVNSVAWSFVAGATGKALSEMLDKMEISHDLIELKQGMTRINVKLKSFNDGSLCETDFNGTGPVIEQDEIDILKEKISGLTKNDMVVISGSIPSSVTQYVFEEVLEQIKKAGADFVADVTGEYLRTALKYKPFLVKPNEDEINEFLDRKIGSFEDAKESGLKLAAMGATNALISMGEKGAVLCTGDGESFAMKAPEGQVVSTIGAGDSMVAGFIAGQAKQFDVQESLKMGICAGSATAFSAGLANGTEIMRLLNGFNI